MEQTSSARQENLHAQLHALLLEYNLIDAAAAVPSHAEAPTTGNWDQAPRRWRAGTETSPPKVPWTREQTLASVAAVEASPTHGPSRTT